MEPPGETMAHPLLLVTGAAGFVGWNLCKEARAAWEVVGAVHEGSAVAPGTTPVRADLLRPESVAELLDARAPAAVVHLAAVADTGRCERDPTGSFPLNVLVPERLALLCARRGIPFAFASTDLVFAGTSAPYGESATPDPICAYGRQKAEAERRIMAAHPHALVCRLPLMFGEASPRSGSFLDPLLRSLRTGPPLRLFADEFRTPADARCVSRGILALLGRAVGIYHLGGPERLSRFALGMLAADAFGLPSTNILPTRQHEVPLASPRPPDVSLDSEAARRFGYAPLPPGQALRRLAADRRRQASGPGSQAGV